MPTPAEIDAMNESVKHYEAFHGVSYSDEVLEDTVQFAKRYIQDRYMPDKAIDIMDEAGASTNVGLEKPDNIKELETRIATIYKEKKEN
jgi:ATP-dependent Clp protease ATP-binding subunit ClpA